MTGQDWTAALVFVATLWGVSIVSPEAALIIGGLVTIGVLVNTGILERLAGAGKKAVA